MRAHYVIDYDGMHTSPTIDIPDGLNKEQAVCYVYGTMMLESWTLDTPHAIYLNDGSGYQFAYGDGDVNEKVFDSIMQDG